jgi:hypothetical protein
MTPIKDIIYGGFIIFVYFTVVFITSLNKTAPSGKNENFRQTRIKKLF